MKNSFILELVEIFHLHYNILIFKNVALSQPFEESSFKHHSIFICHSRCQDLINFDFTSLIISSSICLFG